MLSVNFPRTFNFPRSVNLSLHPELPGRNERLVWIETNVALEGHQGEGVGGYSVACSVQGSGCRVQGLWIETVATVCRGTSLRRNASPYYPTLALCLGSRTIRT